MGRHERDQPYVDPIDDSDDDAEIAAPAGDEVGDEHSLQPYQDVESQDPEATQ